MKTGASIAILVALAICSIVPFAARAVYLDEHVFLHIAESVWQKDWRFPQDTPWIYFGIPFENLAVQTHPPVGEYYLALMFKLFGGFREIPFRLLWGIFPIMAVLGFYRLARHFTASPLAVASLFAVSPAFFVMSPTLMMDIPMLAFFLLGLGFYMDCIQGKHARLWLVPACFILSAGTGYTILIPMGCVFLWAVTKKRPLEELLAFAIAPAALLLWLLVMRSHFGVIPLANVVQYFSKHSNFPSNLLPTFSFLGGVSLLPWAFLAFIDFAKKWIVSGIAILLAVILSISHTWPSQMYRLWYVTLASCGIALLIVFILKSRQRLLDRPIGHGFLVLWLPATMLFFLLVADMVNARYILLGLPPLFLVVFARVRRTAAVAALAATMILSVSLSIGDYRFVNSYREWVARTIVPLQQQGFRVWSATESGLRFYLQQNGIQTLDYSDIRPRGGDLIVRQASFAYGLSKDLEPLLLSIFKEDLKDTYCVRTFARTSGAGFHDCHFGFVPFTISRAPLDQLEIMEVSPFVTNLPQVVPADYSGVPVWFPGGVLLKQIKPEMKFGIKLPRGATVVYQLEGEGTCSISDQGITLKKTNAGPAVWKNFRFIPASLQSRR